MEKEGIINWIDIKKKFDVITETLNIFDLSFLISGSAMLGLCFYAFPIMKVFFVHGNQIFLSILLCIWFSYILGLICRIIGKNIAKYFNYSGNEEKNHEKFSPHFSQIFSKKSEFNTVYSPQEQEDLTYSYMWMRLDTNESADCRNRFLYVSRIWVLRAIYEGLIPSVIFLAIIVLCNGDLEYFSIKVLGGYLAYIGIPLIMILTLIIISFLAREARHCDETLRREIIVAYFDFFGNKDNGRTIKTEE